MSVRPKRRLLILITVQFSVRYILRTGLLKSISRFADPVVWVGWQDEKLYDELRAQGATVHRMPEPSYGKSYNFFREIIKEKYKRIIKSPSLKIDKKRNDVIFGISRISLLNKFIISFYAGVSYLVPHGALVGIHQWLLKMNTNSDAVKEIIMKQQIDALLSVTPFLREEQVILGACQEAKIRTMTSILSFDNITTRGFIPIIFDHYCVWNQSNYDELYRVYPEVKRSTVDIVGPLQFDFYWDQNCLWSREKWLAELGLPEGRRVLLFGGASYAIAPREQDWLEQIDESINANEIVGNPVVLFRKHPVDPIDRWMPVLDKAKNVVRDDPWKSTGTPSAKMNITRYDIEKLCSTLYWSDVHINASSTMTIDGAIFDKPQIGPAYDDHSTRKYDEVVKEIYLREHYKPITNSGGLKVVYSREQLIQAINEGLSNPGKERARRIEMVEGICYYTDGKCTERLSSLVEKYLL
jgi:CDP-Glycerol:Poly(glycerophosphate) glycerophosphotransferase